MFYDRLKYFQTVAEELNVTRSAEKLHLSQQALSSHIARLEEDYRTQFFERRKTGLVLTPEGRHFLAFASAVLRQEEQMAQELADMRLHYTGTVAIGARFRCCRSFCPVSRCAIRRSRSICTSPTSGRASWNRALSAAISTCSSSRRSRSCRRR